MAAKMNALMHVAPATQKWLIVRAGGAEGAAVFASEQTASK
jgi:hypothetical protein